ncbi:MULTISPECIES: outer membrane beta-barrel protein [Nguyenibacter]|uniref:Outer membrane beta-barrel protein n=1 Tax=Nguyenibacter vanlangensis TaxID=1216886 RepID=A0A7Y7IWH2_9PROT|nr:MULTISPECIES: outer membrane beta-barrel protein [Nguyenibacter]NVN11645.1 outer membrane beta-barrel protein [Nguyenibacter vanlangensis]WRH88744.1 outer membrane beta-barrel protein [Nguyenibacter sp. L1]
MAAEHAGRIRHHLATLAALTVAAWSVPAHAQLISQYFPSDLPGYSSPDQADSVVMRQLLSNRPAGIPVGSFILRPSAAVAGGYNTNTLAAPHTASPEFEFDGGLKLNSNWTRNALGVFASVSDRRFPSIPFADYTNWSAGTGGSVALGNDTLALGYTHYQLHLSSMDLGNFGVSRPVPYDANDVRLTYTKLFGRFSLIPAAIYEDYTFGSALGGGIDTSYASLSHRLETGSLTSRFELSTGNAAVMILRGSTAQFTNGGEGNDYADGAGFLGLDLNADSVIRYRLLAGGETRHFTHGPAPAVTTPTFEIDTIWTPRRRDTISIYFYRRILDPASPFARNQTVTDGRVQWDHELRRTVVLRGYAEGGMSQTGRTVAGTASRTQTLFKFGVSANWVINRYVTASLSYSHVNDFSHGGLPPDPLFPTRKSTFASNYVSLGFSFAE